MQNINNAHWEFAYRLFHFVAVASRPLRVKELAELPAAPIPKFDEDCRLKDPVDGVLSTFSSLFAIVNDGYPFGNIIPRCYHVSTSMTPAHTLAAQTCLGILLHLDKDVVSRDNKEKWPLAVYAAKHWVGHVLFEGVSQIVEDG